MTSRSLTTAAKGHKGQALVEFIIFLPFMLMMYTVVVGLGDAINGSINQQKATRAYFFYRLQNNSQISKPQRSGGDLVNNAWTSFGHLFIGWADYLENSVPFMPCYRLNLPFAPAAGDACDQPYTNVTTQFIRVATVYGICGATFQKDDASDGDFVELPSGAPVPEMLDPVLTEGSCWIQ